MFFIDIPFKGCQGRSNRSSIVHALSYFECGVNDSAFYSARALFKTMQLFSTSLAIKFDPDEIEIFCFLLLKAEIHAILAQKL
jgi:hypothetical protein